MIVFLTNEHFQHAQAQYRLPYDANFATQTVKKLPGELALVNTTTIDQIYMLAPVAIE